MAHIGEFALVVIAFSSFVQAWALVSTLGKMRKTMEEAIPLIKEFRETADQANTLMADVREGFHHVSGLVKAVGGAGDTIHQFQEQVSENAKGWLFKALAVGAGVKTVVSVLRGRAQKYERSHSNGT